MQEKTTLSDNTGKLLEKWKLKYIRLQMGISQKDGLLFLLNKCFLALTASSFYTIR